MSVNSKNISGDQALSYLNYLAERHAKDQDIKEAVAHYTNSKALHGRITQLWAKACEALKKGGSVDQDFAQIDRLTAQLDAHVNMFEASLGNISCKYDEEMENEFENDESRIPAARLVFSENRIGRQWMDFVLASKQTLELSRNEKSLDQAKKAHLGNKSSSSIEEEVEGIQKLKTTDSTRKYWYDELVSRSFVKHKTIGDGACALRVAAETPEVEELKCPEETLKHLKFVRKKMLAHIRKNWDYYKNNLSGEGEKAYADFASYKAVMGKHETYLGREELQVLSDMTGDKYNIYYHLAPKTADGKIAPSEVITSKMKPSTGKVIHFYYNPTAGRLHFDLLIPRT